MDRIWITVAETGVFLWQAAKLWTDEDRASFVDYIAANPDAGDIIPDIGGLWKMRISGISPNNVLPRDVDCLEALFAYAEPRRKREGWYRVVPGSAKAIHC